MASIQFVANVLPRNDKNQKRASERAVSKRLGGM
jgi:hypothetical protein